MKETVLEQYRENYREFGPTLATEELAKGTTGNKIKIDHETLRRWLIKEGLWEKRRKRKRHRSWRPRRSHFGELVQMDGSPHKWFGERAGACCLMNMVDDATGKTLSLLDEQETTEAAMRLLWMWIDKHGIPVALYTDRKNVYVPDEKSAERAALRGEESLTQFGRACKELGITIIEAHSPQAKGRIERSNGTYQDRLVKMLRLKKISDIESANRFLHTTFVDELNKQFQVDPAEKADFHRSPKGYDLKAIFSIQEKRSLTDDWIVRFDNNYYQIRRQSTKAPSTHQVKVMKYLDGSLHISYRGKDMAYVQLPARPSPLAKQPQPEKAATRSRTKTTPWVPPPSHPWRKPFKRPTSQAHRGRGSLL